MPTTPTSLDESTPVWFITGATSGFGAATALAALRAGHRVVATARNPDSLTDLVEAAPTRVIPVQLDLRDPDTIIAAVSKTELRFGQIDYLFNNAGIVTIGAIEELDDKLLADQLQINLLGPLAVVRAVLPGMRQRGQGHLLQMSSMGGRYAFPGLGAYHASKFALEGASISLAQEVAPFGLKVTIIEPGDFRTSALGPDRTLSAEPIPAYDGTVGAMRKAIAELNGKQPGDPNKLAEILVEVVAMPNPPLQLALGPDSYYRLEEQLKTQLDDLQKWNHYSLATNLAE